jgi:hypothetical protein
MARRLNPEEELLRPTPTEYALAVVVVIGLVVVIALGLLAVDAIGEMDWGPRFPD